MSDIVTDKNNLNYFCLQTTLHIINPCFTDRIKSICLMLKTIGNRNVNFTKYILF